MGEPKASHQPIPSEHAVLRRTPAELQTEQAAMSPPSASAYPRRWGARLAPEPRKNHRPVSRRTSLDPSQRAEVPIGLKPGGSYWSKAKQTKLPLVGRCNAPRGLLGVRVAASPPRPPLSGGQRVERFLRRGRFWVLRSSRPPVLDLSVQDGSRRGNSSIGDGYGAADETVAGISNNNNNGGSGPGPSPKF